MRKEDNHISRTIRVEGAFPRLTEELSLLFPQNFDLSFIQQVKKTRPGTAMNLLERRTWNKYSFLLSHVAPWSISPPPTLKHSGSSSTFNIFHLQQQQQQ